MSPAILNSLTGAGLAGSFMANSNLSKCRIYASGVQLSYVGFMKENAFGPLRPVDPNG